MESLPYVFLFKIAEKLNSLHANGAVIIILTQPHSKKQQRSFIIENITL